MGQRVMIAMMVVREPDLLMADEPTSALDVTVRTQVLSILDELVTRRGMGLIFISHDLNLVSKFCDRVIVMYAGRIVETLEAKRLNEATHPYTRGLLSCLPSIDGSLEPLPVLQREASVDGGGAMMIAVDNLTVRFGTSAAVKDSFVQRRRGRELRAGRRKRLGQIDDPPDHHGAQLGLDRHDQRRRG